jgi:hypothetical protein
MDPGGELIGPPFSLHSRLYPCPQGDNRSLVAHLANLNLIRKNFLDSVTFFLLSLRPALPSPTVSIQGSGEFRAARLMGLLTFRRTHSIPFFMPGTTKGLHHGSSLVASITESE